jgi:hypothetical protein
MGPESRPAAPATTHIGEIFIFKREAIKIIAGVR